MWLCDDIERWDTNYNAFSPSTFITTPSHHPPSTLPLLAIWTHHIVNVYWQHKRFSVTNSMINLQFVPSLGLDIITENGNWKYQHFVNSKCSSLLPFYLHTHDSVRWDERQRFQLCPYCFCYHHSCCFKLHCDWHIHQIINVTYTDCNFPKLFNCTIFNLLSVRSFFAHIHKKANQRSTRLGLTRHGVWR